MKNCKHCGQEFTPTTNKGHEQLYCTKTCSRHAAIKRHQERLKQQHEKKNNDTTIMEKSMAGYQEFKPEFSESLHRIQESENRDRTNGGPYSDNNRKDYIHEYYEARLECNLYRIRCENLLEKIKALEIENAQLVAELDELEGEDDQDSGGMLGSIMEQFKKDPINSVKFASAIFENISKPKP